MQFNSLEFMIFFPVVLAVYFVVPKKLREGWLLVASYYFYMGWNPVYALLIAASTAITYVCGLMVGGSKPDSGGKKRTIILAACIIINLGILALFKYGNFFINSINSVFNILHINPLQKRFDFLLPVGISFYTFQALGYIIDVYRGDTEVERNPVKYALFVSFFPQLVAGPIERSGNLLSQMRNIEKLRLWNLRRITSGAILMLWGLYMKMVIADRVSILVDTVFNDYRLYGSVPLILGAVGFALQIYCDFGSYSLIAIGAARIMGFTLMENFKAPYLSGSIREFWSRWHISLSTWFRDYVYIPLGGNRRGTARKYLNLMIVFITSGLWHGADWSFVAWGAVHGVYQVIEDFTANFRSGFIKKWKIRSNCFSWKLMRVVVTFILTDIAWVFFRADSIVDALRYLARIVMRPTPWQLFDGFVYDLGLSRVEMNILVFSLVLLMLVDIVRYFLNETLDSFLMKQNLWFCWGIMIVLVLMIFIYGKYGPEFDAKQFIYFQF